MGAFKSVLPETVSLKNNAFVAAGVARAPPLLTQLGDKAPTLAELLGDFAKTQSEDMCYWSFQSLPFPAPYDLDDYTFDKYDEDFKWVHGYGEVALSRFRSIKSNGNMRNAICTMGSRQIKRLCKAGVYRDSRCVDQLTNQKLAWANAIAIFKIGSSWKGNVIDWRGNASLHLPNLAWIFRAGQNTTPTEAWNQGGALPRPGEVNPPGMPTAAPWPMAGTAAWGQQPGCKLVSKVLPCSQIPDKFQGSENDKACDYVDAGSTQSFADEAYENFMNQKSLWPPTTPCADDIASANMLAKNPYGMPAQDDCAAAKVWLEKNVDGWSCDTVFGLLFEFKYMCCSVCGNEDMPDYYKLYGIPPADMQKEMGFGINPKEELSKAVGDAINLV